MTHIIWDRDGCLVDSGTLVFETYREFNKLLDAPRDDLFVSYDVFRLWNRVNWFDNYKIMGLPEDKWPIAHQIFKDRTKGADLDFFQGIPEFVRSNTFTHSIVTGNYEEFTKAHVEKHGLTKEFKLISGYYSGTPINKVDLIQRQLNWLGLKPQEVVLIGDTVDDGRAAKEAGNRFVAAGFGLTHPIRLAEELETRRVPTEFLAETPETLVSYLTEHKY